MTNHDEGSGREFPLYKYCDYLLRWAGKSYSFLIRLLMEEKFDSDVIITDWKAVITEPERQYVSVLVE